MRGLICGSPRILSSSDFFIFFPVNNKSGSSPSVYVYIYISQSLPSKPLFLVHFYDKSKYRRLHILSLSFCLFVYPHFSLTHCTLFLAAEWDRENNVTSSGYRHYEEGKVSAKIILVSLWRNVERIFPYRVAQRLGPEAAEKRDILWEGCHVSHSRVGSQGPKAGCLPLEPRAGTSHRSTGRCKA